MSLIIQYCEGCGERIPSDALENGGALLFQDSYFFGPCKDKILAEHPELVGQAPQPRSQAGGYRASGIFETPIAPDTRRHNKGSSVRLQRKSAAAAPAAGHGSPRRAETSRRSPKQGGRPTDNKAMYAAAGGVVLVAIVALVAMGSGSSRDRDGNGPNTPQDPKGSGAGSPKTPVVRDEQADKLAAFEKKVAANPTQYQDLLDEAAELERLVAGGPHAVRLQEITAKITQRLADASTRAFADVKKAADQLIGGSKFDEAIAAWDAFDPTLRTEAIIKKIVAEKDRVEAARQKIGLAHQDKIPKEGDPVTLLGPDVRWRTKGTVWTLVDGELAPPVAPEQSFTFACKGSVTSFGDYYLTFEYQLAAGALVLIARVTDNDKEGAPNQLVLPVTPAGWKRVHVVAKGQVVQTWYDGEPSTLVQSPATVMAGAIGFIAAQSCKAKIRGLEARVQAFGRDLVIVEGPPPTPPADLPPLPAPVLAKQRPLFDGKNLQGWTMSNAANWTIAEGVLKCAATDTATWMRTGDDTWTSYTIRFEYRRVVGQLMVLYNWRTGEPARFNIPPTPEAAEEWLTCVVVVKPTEITAYPVRAGKVSGNPFHAKYAQTAGRFGLALTGTNSAEVRNITFERHD